MTGLPPILTNLNDANSVLILAAIGTRIPHDYNALITTADNLHNNPPLFQLPTTKSESLRVRYQHPRKEMKTLHQRLAEKSLAKFCTCVAAAKMLRRPKPSTQASAAQG